MALRTGKSNGGSKKASKKVTKKAPTRRARDEEENDDEEEPEDEEDERPRGRRRTEEEDFGGDIDLDEEDFTSDFPEWLPREHGTYTGILTFVEKSSNDFGKRRVIGNIKIETSDNESVDKGEVRSFMLSYPDSHNNKKMRMQALQEFVQIFCDGSLNDGLKELCAAAKKEKLAGMKLRFKILARMRADKNDDTIEYCNLTYKSVD